MSYPFVRWPSGTPRVATHLMRRLPDSFSSYVSPFLGAGALPLMMGARLQGHDVIVADDNEALVRMWRHVVDDVAPLASEIEALDADLPGDALGAKTAYYARRGEYNELVRSGTDGAREAALFIWLNAHCFGDTWHVDDDGCLVMPWGGTEARRIGTDAVLAAHETMRGAVVRVGGLHETCSEAGEGDLLVLDPPRNRVAGDLVGVTRDEVWDEFESATARGARVMMVDFDTSAVRRRYSAYRVDRYRSRDSVREVVVTNWKGDGR